jgi:hypothetical protein
MTVIACLHPMLIYTLNYIKKFFRIKYIIVQAQNSEHEGAFVQVSLLV